MLNASGFANKLVAVIINPLIALIFAAGLLVFIWGLVEFLWALNNQGKGVGTGKMHMLWGIIGMFVMVAAYTIIKIISNTLGTPLPGGY